MKFPWKCILICLRRHPVLSLMAALLMTLLAFGGYRAAVHVYVQKHRKEAEAAEACYALDEAERQLTLCLHAQPDNPALHLRLARVCRRANRFPQAEEHLRACRRLEGRNPETALESLLLRVQGGNLADVENLLLEQIFLDSPDTNLILEAMAQGYICIYHLDAARGCLDRLLQRQPNNITALLLRASLWTTAGNYRGAVEDCRRAVEAQPNHRAAHLRLGESLLLAEQPQEALHQFEYLRRQPGGEEAEVLRGRAHAHRQLGETETARRILDELLARNPHDGAALIERGDLSLQIESPADAEKWLRQAIADYPHDMRANFLLFQALQKQGQLEEAARYDAARKQIEEDGKALRIAFERVLKNPPDPEPRLEAGLICLRNGREDEGERWLLSAVEQAPTHAPTRAALVELYERTGKAELAARYRP